MTEARQQEREELIESLQVIRARQTQESQIPGKRLPQTSITLLTSYHC